MIPGETVREMKTRKAKMYDLGWVEGKEPDTWFCKECKQAYNLVSCQSDCHPPYGTCEWCSAP